MRMSRQRPAANAGLELPVPRDAETDLDGRPSEELTALPISETEERPGRRARSGGGFFKVLFIGAAAGRRRLGGRQVLAGDQGPAGWRGAIRPERGASPSTRAMWVKQSRRPNKQKPARAAGRLSRRRNRPRVQAGRGAPPRGGGPAARGQEGGRQG